MEFSEAITLMEKGSMITRPGWLGYLFLDIDDNIKHAGQKGEKERFWKIDVSLRDWEEYTGMKGNIKETETSRIESLMETNSAHISRLYYLEEMIEKQNNVFKRISDSINISMDGTDKILSETVKHIPSMSRNIEKLSKLPQELKRITNALRSMTKEIDKIGKKINVKEKQLQHDLKPKNNDITEEEKAEMEEVRKKLEIRKKNKKREDSKGVMAPKLSK